MTNSFVIFRRAAGDFHKIVKWLKTRSPAGAEAWRFAFAECLAEIISDPSRYEKVAEGSVPPHGIRQALFHTRRGNKYRIVFQVVGFEVRVLRIRGPGQRNLRDRDLH